MTDKPVLYTSFILLGHGRSGSTVLTEALRRHGRIRMYGEIFHEDPAERERASGPDRPYRHDESGRRYLDEVIFRRRWWKELQAVGFKLFGDHALTGPMSSAWQRLMRDRAVRVVLLRRDNLLRTLISYEVAVRTDEWVLPLGAELPADRPEPFAINPHRAREFFDDIRGQQQRLRAAFSDHPMIELEYSQDVLSGFTETVWRIYDFLGIAEGPVEVTIQKQARVPPTDQVANIAELADHFRGSEYERFFSDIAVQEPTP